jgi:DNA-binding LacI/PurR family transcriptional regulator
MFVKQIDIADYCNVSQAAVSKVLKNPEHPEFPEATRNRIIDAAQKLNYVPNQLAGSLRRGKLDAISLISVYNVPELQDHICQTAKQAELNVMLQLAREEVNTQMLLALQTALGNKHAGLIFLPGWNDAPQSSPDEYRDIREMFSSANCPIVWLEDYPIRQENADYVWCDDTAGIAHAVEHLLQQGYTHFVFLVASRPGLLEIPRWSIFKDLVEQAGYQARYAQGVGMGTHADDAQVHQLVQQCPSGTAIVCEGDWPAVPVLHSARKLGRRIPNELGLLIYGDQKLGGGFSLGETTLPTITSIRRPFDAIGRRAAQRLAERIEGKVSGPMRRDIFPTELIVRESTQRNF